jgi:hypothetical protein
MIRHALALSMGCSLCFAACARQSPDGAVSNPRTGVVEPTQSQAPSPPPVSEPPTTTPSQAEREEPKKEPVALLSFERVLDRPIRSIALGNPPSVAVLSDQPWVFDAGGWKEVPLPAAHALAPESRVEIYFGRDNRPRLMGSTLDGAEGSAAIYLRLKAPGWQREPGEIGRLGGLPRGGLFGVLGHDDPEVVCKVDDVCIVKRRTGWTTVPSGPGMPRVFMHDGAVFALHGDRVMTLGDKGWEAPGRAAPWSGGTGLWGSPEAGPWVSVAGENALYLREGESWTRVSSPVQEPRGLWGTSARDVWVGGKDGLGHYDGVEWRIVRGVPGPLEVVTGSGPEDVWVGGKAGLFHGTKASREEKPK